MWRGGGLFQNHVGVRHAADPSPGWNGDIAKLTGGRRSCEWCWALVSCWRRGDYLREWQGENWRGLWWRLRAGGQQAAAGQHDSATDEFEPA
jgi:hypothetical protein